MMSIKRIIVVVIGLLIILVGAIGTLGIHTTSSVVSLMKDVTLSDARQLTLINDVMLKMEINRTQLLMAVQHNPSNEYSKLHDHPITVHFETIERNSNQLRASWRELSGLISTPEARALVNEFEKTSASLGVEKAQAASMALQNKQWEAASNIVYTEINPMYVKVHKIYGALQKYINEHRLENATAVDNKIVSQRNVILFTAICGALLAMLAAVLLVRAISNPLLEAVRVASRVTKGDLSGKFEIRSRNEFGQLLMALRDMNAGLANIVGEVRASATEIAADSVKIASGNEDLSGRTERQAAALEATSASIEELTSTVRQNADNARQANVLAASACEVAGKGGAVVTEVVATMGAIDASAKRIVDIISVIDGIAFQTNILALNAAVEAARAGEQGRGFAVVASEVRTLAQRSAAAAKEIKMLIGDSVEKVQIGTKLVDQAGATMQEIVHGTRRVADIMSEITLASSEQAAGIEQIHEAVAHMDQGTQQNAELVSAVLMAAQSLQDRAAHLAHLVSIFLIDDRHGVPASSAKKLTLSIPAMKGAPMTRALAPVAAQ